MKKYKKHLIASLICVLIYAAFITILALSKSEISSFPFFIMLGICVLIWKTIVNSGKEKNP